MMAKIVAAAGRVMGATLVAAMIALPLGPVMTTATAASPRLDSATVQDQIKPHSDAKCKGKADCPTPTPEPPPVAALAPASVGAAAATPAAPVGATPPVTLARVTVVAPRPVVAIPAAAIPILHPQPAGPAGALPAAPASQSTLRSLVPAAGGPLAAVSGLALGAAVHLLPLFLALDGLALALLLVVLRRTFGPDA